MRSLAQEHVGSVNYLNMSGVLLSGGGLISLSLGVSDTSNSFNSAGSRYRNYHPELGRFLQRDPAGYVDGANVYEYVAGNAVQMTDPLGLEDLNPQGPLKMSTGPLDYVGGWESYKTIDGVTHRYFIDANKNAFLPVELKTHEEVCSYFAELRKKHIACPSNLEDQAYAEIGKGQTVIAPNLENDPILTHLSKQWTGNLSEQQQESIKQLMQMVCAAAQVDPEKYMDLIDRYQKGELSVPGVVGAIAWDTVMDRLGGKIISGIGKKLLAKIKPSNVKGVIASGTSATTVSGRGGISGPKNALADTSNLAKPLGRGSTGRTAAANLNEQLAMKQAMSNPGAGSPVPLMKGMTDPRWPASDGWVKMRQEINGTKIHYVRNMRTGAVDDFKFKD